MVPLALQGVEYLVDFQLMRRFDDEKVLSLLLYYIGCNVTFAFFDIHAIAGVNLVTYPAGNVFGSRIEWQELVEIAVVKVSGDTFLDVREVYHHSVGIKFASPAVYCHYPVVSVKTAAFARIG